jgi:hypothetical protein
MGTKPTFQTRPWTVDAVAMTKQEIDQAVLDIVQRASRGKGSRPKYVTSYQILNRLKKPIRNFIQKTGKSGKGGGWYDSGAQVVKRACLRLYKAGEIEQPEYFDTRGVHFDIRDQIGQPVRAGYSVCGLYRVK